MPAYSPKDYNLSPQALIAPEPADHTDDWEAYCAVAKRLDPALIRQQLADAISNLDAGPIVDAITNALAYPYEPGNPSHPSRFTAGAAEIGAQVLKIIAAAEDDAVNLHMIVGLAMALKTYVVEANIIIGLHTIVQAESADEAIEMAEARDLCRLGSPESANEAWVHSGPMDGQPKIWISKEL